MMAHFVKFTLTLMVCLLLTAAQNLWAASNGQRPKVGLVLGGGGAAGIAHVGVLKVLEENGIPIDMIAGTSMGAIVGSLYASGYRADELEKVVKSLDWADLFQDGQERSVQTFQQKQENAGFFNTFELGVKDKALKLPDGLVNGQKLIFELRRLLERSAGINDFDRLPIPFRAVATDIETGEAVILSKGNLPTAVRASMSIPGLFSPVMIDNRLLVDGFVSNNVPVDVAQQMGADILIVVSIPYYFDKKEKLNSVLAVTFQSMQFLTAKNSLPQLKNLHAPHIVLEPVLKDIGSLDFGKGEAAIPIGEAAAREQLAGLKRIVALTGQAQPANSLQIAVNKEAAAQGVESMETESTRTLKDAAKTIARIQVKNTSALADAVILNKLGVYPGDRFNLDTLQRGLENIHSLGYFDLVDYRLGTTPAGAYELTIIANERSTGDNRLRFGFSLQDNFEGDTEYQLGVRHIIKGVTPSGGEWRNSAVIGDQLRIESELHNPLSSDQSAFVEGQASHDRRDIFVYNGEDRVAELRLAETGIQTEWGKDIGQNREVRAGVFYRHLEPTLKTGFIDLPGSSINLTGVQFSYGVDTLDNADFPGRGRWFEAAYVHGFKILGADAAFDRLTLDIGQAWTIDKHRVLLKAEVASTLSDDALVIEQPTLGGVGRLSGLANEQLRGDYAALATGTYMYELTDFPGIAKVYAGGSLETGNTWDKQSEVSWGSLLLSGSLFLGMDSPIGPAFVGIGQTEGFESQLFMQVGRSF